MTVELLFFSGCPHVERSRALLRRCIVEMGASVEVRELEGDHPSPSIRIDGVDVMGPPPTRERACRLDLPTEEKIMAALRAGARP